MRIAATIVLTLVLITWSAATFVIEVETLPIREVAKRLEKGSHISLEPRFFERIDKAVEEDRWCVREGVLSNTTIRLAVIDAAYRDQDAARQTEALAKARETLRRGLLCFPGDGNLWLRLAMVEFAQGGLSSRVAELLKTSLAKAPSEAWIIKPRITFAVQLDAADFPIVGEVLDTDVRNFLTFAHLPDIAEFYVEGDARLRSALAAGLPAVEPERGAAIERIVAAKLDEAERALKVCIETCNRQKQRNEDDCSACRQPIR
jgi:hypothetical protein